MVSGSVNPAGPVTVVQAENARKTRKPKGKNRRKKCEDMKDSFQEKITRTL
ncbi:hypothetical protein LptCag_1510 [Leptospirillum ferriphilum]|jgi:hypothetical protein|uniref:Uncharacterized protein n=1 Tax=Leptospirillum ferriphilum TaxID=178606 RepID=A0A094WBC2_9BACT|nr:hypothetical protein LptCag_1510 [Leptospirillum ferriphilum]